MSEYHKNNPDFFPGLRFHTLEAYAHKWGISSYWPFIKRIALYKVPVASGFKKKYLLLFETSENTNKFDKMFLQNLKSPNWLMSLGEDDNSFREVYKKEPDRNYLVEWTAATELPEGIAKKFSWVLFSRTKTTEQHPVEKKLRPNQKAKIKCREIAEQLREKKSNITIADAIRHRDMIKARAKKGGSLYIEKTARDWIKDLWPEERRKPGRPKKGT